MSSWNLIETMLWNPQLLLKGGLGNPKAKYWGKNPGNIYIKVEKMQSSLQVSLFHLKIITIYIKKEIKMHIKTDSRKCAFGALSETTCIDYKIPEIFKGMNKKI